MDAYPPSKVLPAAICSRRHPADKKSFQLQTFPWRTSTNAKALCCGVCPDPWGSSVCLGLHHFMPGPVSLCTNWMYESKIASETQWVREVTEFPCNASFL